MLTALGILVLLGGLGACASVPKLDEAIGHEAGGGATPILVGSRGPLTRAESRAMLQRLEEQAKDTTCSSTTSPSSRHWPGIR